MSRGSAIALLVGALLLLAFALTAGPNGLLGFREKTAFALAWAATAAGLALLLLAWRRGASPDTPLPRRPALWVLGGAHAGAVLTGLAFLAWWMGDDFATLGTQNGGVLLQLALLAPLSALLWAHPGPPALLLAGAILGAGAGLAAWNRTSARAPIAPPPLVAPPRAKAAFAAALLLSLAAIFLAYWARGTLLFVGQRGFDPTVAPPDPDPTRYLVADLLCLLALAALAWGLILLARTPGAGATGRAPAAVLGAAAAYVAALALAIALGKVQARFLPGTETLGMPRTLLRHLLEGPSTFPQPLAEGLHLFATLLAMALCGWLAARILPPRGDKRP